MKRLFLASAAALSMIAVPAAAQVGGAGPDATTASVADKRSVEMTDEQRAMYESWPADRRGEFDRWDSDRQVMYFGWTDALRGYYWDLEPGQQEAWWYLDDEQRISLFQLDETQRASAWNSIMDQVNQSESRQQAATTRPANAAATGETRFVRNEVAQSAPAAQQPAEYPVCQSDADDSCINAWAAGQRGAGVERPLDYWPEQPASTL